MLDRDQIDAFARDRILSVYAERVAATVPHLPGGEITREDRPGLYKRVASICGVTVDAVRETVGVQHG
ncbi:hypothetical protein LV780_04705 [Cereibacter azotoformans]|uniref:hypothetical protein n=1 Tax=Cereibacter azotoformans TaxID=43057 RepID=UPI000E35CAC2|nr:hypothetical protein [Cereibacter azotoformans]AXQ93172.1 hypothetical protein D0Z66_04705 [Cereibacter sphaeroides]UIJ31481.1 hypothetical protein LV780_04705 [Cereibacter azotoformans]